MSRPKIGVVVNPIAGLGGTVALNGTDGMAAEALRRGAVPAAAMRATRALTALFAAAPELGVLTVPGPMGGLSAVEAGFSPTLLGDEPRLPTTASDTVDAAGRVLRAGADLLLFAGGDGTARDIHAAIGGRIPILGIPTGVKMQSSVFATGPEAAGTCAAGYLAARDRRSRLEDREIMDMDEEARRQGIISPRLYGVARVPFERRLLQSAKSAVAPRPDEDLRAACRHLSATMQPGMMYLVGPGTTTLALERMLGLDGSLLGVDAVLDGRLAGRDLSESGIRDLMEGRRVGLILGIPGGQGCLFGRGNQPLSPVVLASVPRENITVLAAADKLLALQPCRLFVDTGDPDLDARLTGYWRVTTGLDRTMMMRVTR